MREGEIFLLIQFNVRIVSYVSQEMYLFLGYIIIVVHFGTEENNKNAINE